jgi:hypothetical protein
MAKRLAGDDRRHLHDVRPRRVAAADNPRYATAIGVTTADDLLELSSIDLDVADAVLARMPAGA